MAALDFDAFWKRLTRSVLYFMSQKGYTEITIVIQDGNLQRVKVNQSFLPTDIPKV